MIVDESRLTPLGGGGAAPAGSLADLALAARLAAYKRNVAGNYRSVAPGNLAKAIPAGEHTVSEKVDGETWFLHVEGGEAALVSPAGKVIVGLPLLDEAVFLVGDHAVLAAGELYATVPHGRPRVHDLHAALRGGKNAATDRLRFAAFDLLRDGDEDAQQRPFARRVERLRELFEPGERIHAARFETADGPTGVVAAYARIVTRDGAEGIVVRAADGRIFKIKPEIAIDAGVVGFAQGGDGGIAELLLALVDGEHRFRLIGRVRTGFSDAERRALFDTLSRMTCDSPCRIAADHGVLYRWVRPEIVVEVKCNDLLTVRAADEPIRRTALEFSDAASWTALGLLPSVSMMGAAFVRVREDKRVDAHDVRFSQVTDLVPVEPEPNQPTAPLPASEIVRREVFTRQTKAGLAVRKLVVWKTNKHPADPAVPAWVAFFTDFAPGREPPLKTDIRVASAREKIEIHADLWLAAKIKRGWTAVSRVGAPKKAGARSAAAADSLEREILALARDGTGESSDTGVTISFGRSPSVNFAEALRCVKKLAGRGAIRAETDDAGRLRHVELSMTDQIVAASADLASLVGLVRTWKSAEVAFGGEALEGRDLDAVLHRLREIRRCWQHHRKTGCDGSGTRLACRMLRIEATPDFLRYAPSLQSWWAVGQFSGGVVAIDKDALRSQVNSDCNELCRRCPLYDPGAVEKKIADLPDALDPGRDERWTMLFHRATGDPAWVVPASLHNLPWALVREGEARGLSGHVGLPASLGSEAGRIAIPPVRRIPPARYDDVRGQDAAVEAVRDCVELPIKHADIFRHVGARGGRGVLLYGPPGNGKTLLAKAVAGESGAHIEIVAGPELLSKWVGEAEERLRAVFERARKLAPSVILFDEIDAIGVPRETADGTHHKTLVSQLLVLLDGLEDRGNVLVLGTTNRIEDVDPALRRPGRFDRMIHVGSPSEEGCAAVFARHMTGMRIDPEVDPDELARLAPGFSGAQIELACREAALLCVKDAIRDGTPPESVAVCREHFLRAIERMRREKRDCAPGRPGPNGDSMRVTSLNRPSLVPGSATVVGLEKELDGSLAIR